MSDAPQYAGAGGYFNDEIIDNAGAGATVNAAYDAAADLLVRSILVSNAGAADIDLDVIFKIDGGSDRFVARVTIPAPAGRAPAVPPVQLVDEAVLPGIPVDPNRQIILPATVALRLKPAVVPGVGDDVHVVTLGSKF